MMELQIRMKCTFELKENEIKSLITLKQQHWGYSDDEQIKWLNKNIKAEDHHLLINEGGVLLAYLSAVNVVVNINQSIHRMLGIGNVCVNLEYTHTGVGSILMACANAFIKKSNTPGILLCKEKLIPFYKASNWIEITPENIVIQEHPYLHKVMVFDPIKMLNFKEILQINLSRSF